MRIQVVLVTFNRLKDLKGTLAAYEQMTVPPTIITVVDNHSNDGTPEFLAGWLAESGRFTREVLTMESNIGGSGGFSRGMKHALAGDADWVFVADDDAVPRPDAFEKMELFMQGHPEEMKDIVCVCTAVHNVDHNAGIHRCLLKKTILGRVETPVPEKMYAKEYFDVDIYSFVGSMFRKDALEKAGIAREDFFIYQDDYEHAIRMGKQGRMVCVPAAVMDHVDNLTNSKEATWRDYYAARNAVIMYKEHFGTFAGFMRALRRFMVGCLSLNPKKLKLMRIAFKDGFDGKSGIHPVYKPGWKQE